MSEPCTSQPVSWLRLERFHLGELRAPERATIAEHLLACPACAACLVRIKEDDTRALPSLSVPKPVAGRAVSRFPVRFAAAACALAAAAAVVIAVGVRRTAGPGEHVSSTTAPQDRVKGDAVAFALVREDDERIVEPAGVYRDGDRFKALVTCPPGAKLSFDVAVYDADGTSFPLVAAPDLGCGNEVSLPGAFRLTGDSLETVCLVWSDAGPVDRAAIARDRAAAGWVLCKRLRPAVSKP